MKASDVTVSVKMPHSDSTATYRLVNGTQSRSRIDTVLPATSPITPTSSSSPSASSASSSASDDGYFLCVNLSLYSLLFRFISLSFGLFLFFLINSYVEEFIFKSQVNFHYGWFLTAFELTLFALFALMERAAAIIQNMYVPNNILSNNNNNNNINNNNTLNTTAATTTTSSSSDWSQLFAHRADLRYHMYVAIAMSMSRGLTNVSLEYLSYPTQVVCKSLKLLTVMIGSICVLNVKFSLDEYISALALVASAALFSFTDVTASSTSANHSDGDSNAAIIGLLVVSLSLIADSAHATTQQSLIITHLSSSTETMFFTNAFSSIICWFIVIINQEFYPAINYIIYQHPTAIYLFLIRAIVLYFGVMCFLLFIQFFGIVHATAITTIRKIISIILSFIIFPKPFSILYIYGLGLFVFGVGISVYSGYTKSSSSSSVAATTTTANCEKRSDEVTFDESDTNEDAIQLSRLIDSPTHSPTATDSLPSSPPFHPEQHLTNNGTSSSIVRKSSISPSSLP